MRKLASRIVTIHDVMPSTMDDVNDCLTACRSLNISPVYLLVVPGLDWRPDQIANLRTFAQSGHKLVAHGWVHRIDRINGLSHWLHSKLISRCVAEHLTLDSQGIIGMMQQSRLWFESKQLPTPDLYVPPAWALGHVKLKHLKQTGFRYVECQRGIYDTHLDVFKKLPLLGYEVDTLSRECFVHVWNRLNRYCERFAKPARLSIHPGDFSLRLRDELRSDLQVTRGVSVASAFEDLEVDHLVASRSNAKTFSKDRL